MVRNAIIAACLMCPVCLLTAQEKKASYPRFNSNAALSHELKPHRRSIPLFGVKQGYNQIRLTLIISASGDVVHAEAGGDLDALKFWPEIEPEVSGWKFTPFERDGKAITAQVEEYVDLAAPERLPDKHSTPPTIKDDSKIAITLERSGCMGTCPAYLVTVTTDSIIFEGHSFVVAEGRHTDPISADEVRKLARKIVASDFYSMDSAYSASVSDCPMYAISISIDGQEKEVVDYMGPWVGMPAVITELEDDVDKLADTDRWVKGNEGLVDALQAEKFRFKTREAQSLLKAAAVQGQAATVEELLQAGVPLKPLHGLSARLQSMASPFAKIGWLTAASNYPDVLRVLMDASASESDQKDQDLALVGAARSGKVEAARMLIDYGANPNADLSKLTVTESGGGMTIEGEGAGSILIYAAQSGNPEMVSEILRSRPQLEARDHEGNTALIGAASGSDDDDDDGQRAQCVRLLANAGADINARNDEGNTALHETYDTAVEKTLLELGADVNARNNDGETPIFTTVDNEAIALYVAHGADLTIRDDKGETAMEAAKSQGPLRQAAFQQAMATFSQH